MGPRGDVIAELDWYVGRVLAEIERQNLTENTLVIFSSDNGPVVDDGYKDQAVEKLGDHRPPGPYRGGKYSIFEAGTRIPLIVNWPRRVKPAVSTALVSQVDFLASFAGLTGGKLPQNAGPDSFDVMPALLGEAKSGRDHLVEHAGVLSLRKGNWKLILPGKGARFNPNVNIELGNDLQPQLYDVSGDRAETKNLAAQHPEKVRELTAMLEKIRKDGRSRP